MRCDCCYKKKENLNQCGELFVCEDCKEKVKKCPICGQYYFDFEGMPIIYEDREIEVCYDCYLDGYDV